MLRLAMLTGWKSRMRGYRDSGDSVPLVITTDRNLLNTGFIARLASRQLQQQNTPSYEQHDGRKQPGMLYRL
jgi:hypothetical protein